MRVWLFTNVKDEENIVEWCWHHARFGFDRIHIFDHNSACSVESVLSPFREQIQNSVGGRETQVVVERIDWALPVKMRAMNYALEMCKKNQVDWILYIDGDEYLSLHEKHHDSIKSFIEFAVNASSPSSSSSSSFSSSASSSSSSFSSSPATAKSATNVASSTTPKEITTIMPNNIATTTTTTQMHRPQLSSRNALLKTARRPIRNQIPTTTAASTASTATKTLPDAVGAIAINWLLFGSNRLDEQPSSHTLMEHFTACENKCNHHVKTVVCVKYATTANNPHFYCLDRKMRCKTVNAAGKLFDCNAPRGVDVATQRIARHYARIPTFGPFNFNTCDAPEQEEALIAHYLHQSYARYVARKVKRQRDDDGTYRDHEQKMPDKEKFHSQFNDRQFTGMSTRYAIKELFKNS